MNKQRLTAKTQAIYKDKLVKKQKYKCSICQLDLRTIKKQQWHLDHSHDNGHCRSVMCSVCNGQEGKTKSKANMVCKYSDTGMTPSEYLRRLADYWEQDFSKEPIHETHAREQIKRYKRLTAKDQNKYLTDNNVEPGKNTTERAKQARKLLKEGKIWL